MVIASITSRARTSAPSPQLGNESPRPKGQPCAQRHQPAFDANRPCPSTARGQTDASASCAMKSKSVGVIAQPGELARSERPRSGRTAEARPACATRRGHAPHHARRFVLHQDGAVRGRDRARAIGPSEPMPVNTTASVPPPQRRRPRCGTTDRPPAGRNSRAAFASSVIGPPRALEHI